MKILSGVFEGKTTGTPIALLIENEDQRSQGLRGDQGQLPPRPRRLHLLGQIRHPRLSRRRPLLGARDRDARRRRRDRAQDPGRRASRIRGALVQMGPHKIDRARWDWDAVDDNPFCCPDRQIGAALGRLSRRRAQGRLVDRRRDRGGGRGRAGRAGRADLRQARRRSRRGDDEHQRREGRRDRRRLRRGGAVRRGECRRDAHAATARSSSSPTMPAASWAASRPARRSSCASR